MYTAGGINPLLCFTAPDPCDIDFGDLEIDTIEEYIILFLIEPVQAQIDDICSGVAPVGKSAMLAGASALLGK